MRLAIQHHRKNRLSNEQGIALLMSLLMLVMLSVLGIASISLSSIDLQSTGYERKITRAFSSAESGLTQARSDLKSFVLATPQNGQWPATDSTVVTGIMGGEPSKQYAQTVSGESLTFSYVLSDFGNATDRTVLIQSTGTFANVQQRVEAIFQYQPPTIIGSQECYNTQCTSLEQNSGKAVNFNGTPNSSVTL